MVSYLPVYPINTKN